MKEKYVRAGWGIKVETRHKGMLLQDTGFFKNKKDVRRWVEEYCPGLKYEIIPLFARQSDLQPKRKD